MNGLPLKTGASVLGLALMVGACEAPTSPPPPEESVQLSAASHLSLATRAELLLARAATAKYHDIQRALDDGYVDIGLVVPGQGAHYLRPEIVDGTFDPKRPELLLYAPWGDRLWLVGVEYAVPVGLSPEAPEGFTGDADHWHLEAEAGLWVLHAWIWLPNPNGIFADSNPLVP